MKEQSMSTPQEHQPQRPPAPPSGQTPKPNGEVRPEHVDMSSATGIMDRVIEGAIGKALAHADVRTVFGEPVTKGDRTVIPVARITANYGFGAGGGEGQREEDRNHGSGGGGGGGGRVKAHPIGFIEMSNDTAQFVPIIDRGEMMARFSMLAIIAMALLLPALFANRQSQQSKRRMWGR
jgi:uncharacterized spore protein YtfJ